MKTVEKDIRVIDTEGGHTERVLLVRIDKRGALVEVISGWFMRKGRYRSTGNRFYVPVNQARKVK